eukprot:TRINITY_DN5772_c0_g1_i1.p1 TRINITY_DN5772_c0_g1~~TRINITY_DN5772_c0_g1_i1.p1  ORF type:complete len:301 (-),score=24.96 TRINITY_DN5772_c0_g1_i1:192-1040(-)
MAFRPLVFAGTWWTLVAYVQDSASNQDGLCMSSDESDEMAALQQQNHMKVRAHANATVSSKPVCYNLACGCGEGPHGCSEGSWCSASAERCQTCAGRWCDGSAPAPPPSPEPAPATEDAVPQPAPVPPPAPATENASSTGSSKPICYNVACGCGEGPHGCSEGSWCSASKERCSTCAGRWCDGSAPAPPPAPEPVPATEDTEPQPTAPPATEDAAPAPQPTSVPPPAPATENASSTGSGKALCYNVACGCGEGPHGCSEGDWCSASESQCKTCAGRWCPGAR